MLAARLIARTPSAQQHSLGHVAGRRLTFNKKSDDNSGKGNMEAASHEGQQVEGVLFWINSGEKEPLREAEGYGHGYDEEIVDVVTPAGAEKALAYVASADAVDSTRWPYHWYKGLVVAGAIEQGLPREYVDGLWAVNSVNDPRPNRTRKREAEALLRDTGLVWDWYVRTVDEKFSALNA